MDIAKEIEQAMSVHEQWRARLEEAIQEGQSRYSPEMLRSDNACDFGKWLYSLSLEDRASEYWDRARAFHADFHVAAARTLRFAVSGRRPEAEAMLAKGGEFETASRELIMTMKDWEKSLALRGMG